MKDRIRLFIRLMPISNFIDQPRRQIVLFYHLLERLSFARSLKTVGKHVRIIHYRFSSCFYDRTQNVLLLAFSKTTVRLSPKNERTAISKQSYFPVTSPATSPKDH